MRFVRTAFRTLAAAARPPKLPATPHLPALSPSLLRRAMSSAVAKRLQGKTIVITGASSGIGRSTAFEFARPAPQDLKLVLTARRIDTLKQIAADITKEVGAGVKVHPVQLDVSKPEEIRGFVDGLPDEFKEIDVLVNNAYVVPPSPLSPRPDGRRPRPEHGQAPSGRTLLTTVCAAAASSRAWPGRPRSPKRT